MASKVVVYHGGRGSGKTLSMSVEGLLTLLSGKQVWANFPIEFDYRARNGQIIRYKSNEVEIEDLVTFRPEIRDGLILLDELSIWANNRGHAAMLNRLLNAWLQLIRKRKLSLFITTQSFDSLDKFIRWQTDATIWCNDMHFRYRKLPEGAVVSHRITDWSGMYTGRPLTSWSDKTDIEKNTRYRRLNAKRFWGIYNSWTEFDILQAMTKYEVKREVKIIEREDIGSANASSPGYDDVISYIKPGLPVNTPLDKKSLIGQLRDMGITGGDRQLTQMLKNSGFVENKSGLLLPGDDC